MATIRSFLKWAGNKYTSLNTILPAFSLERTRLIEPFTGSGVIFMNTHYEEYLLAENNADLIALFQFVQEEGIVFIDYCERLFTAEHNTSGVYYASRNEFNTTIDLRRKAALFLYLNRHCLIDNTMC